MKLHGNRNRSIRCGSMANGVFAALLVLAGGLGSGCSNPNAPVISPGEVVLVTSPERDQLWMIVPASGAITARLALGGKAQGAAASSDGSTLYVGISGAGFRNELVAIDTRVNRVAWRLRLGSNGQPNFLDGVGLNSGEALALSHDGQSLYLWRAVKDGVTGITLVDVSTRRPTAFSGPWNVAGSGLVPIPPSAPRWSGALAVVGSRANAAGGPRRGSSVFVLDPVSLQVVDSILAGDLGGAQGEDIWEVVPSPDGQTLYIAGSQRLVRYSLADQRVIASVARPAPGLLSVTSDGETLIVTDGGTWPDFPGSGLLYAYGPNFEPHGSIDVSTPLGGRPSGPTATVTGPTAMSLDGRTIYVRAGTLSIGPLYTPQPARLLIVDIIGRTLQRTVDLGGFGGGFVFVRHY
ncbi:hypothetical protein BH23GEM1_BH23GEM1_07500 [soil metagenome]